MSIHWADVIAEKLEKSGPHTIATGITPSGPVHIGNMREVMTAEAVYRALLDRGVEAKLIYIADTYDRKRSLLILSMSLALKLSEAFDGQLPISYSGGVDALNLERVLATGTSGPAKANSNIESRSAHHRLAQVADVEDAGRVAHGGVLGEDAATGVLQGHLPPAELGELRAEIEVTVVQR